VSYLTGSGVTTIGAGAAGAGAGAGSGIAIAEKSTPEKSIAPMPSQAVSDISTAAEATTRRSAVLFILLDCESREDARNYPC
jgi:hypothetical protein